MTVSSRIRQILYPLLVFMIISSLWVVGRAQEMEEEIRIGVGPTQRWASLVESQSSPAE